jgi:hypothetical protein
MCCIIVVKVKQTVGSSFFVGFPSDRIRKVTKDVNEHLFISSSSSCKLFQRIPVNYTSELREIFEGTTYSYECNSPQNKEKNNVTKYICNICLCNCDAVYFLSDTAST